VVAVYLCDGDHTVTRSTLHTKHSRDSLEERLSRGFCTQGIDLKPRCEFDQAVTPQLWKTAGLLSASELSCHGSTTTL
jgi:hypothetical protein